MNKKLKGKNYNSFRQSLELSNNFKQIIQSSNVIQDKPERVNMKFETFDCKFSIHFIDQTIFQDAIILIRKFYGYRYQIEILEDNEQLNEKTNR